MSVQPVNGASSKPINIGSEIEPFAPPLLEGAYSTVPVGVQRLIASFLPFSKESFYTCVDADEFAASLPPGVAAGQNPNHVYSTIGAQKGPIVSAQPGEATIDALCERTGAVFKQQNLESIAKLREASESCTSLSLFDPTLFQGQPLQNPRCDQNSVYSISCAAFCSSLDESLKQHPHARFIELGAIDCSTQEMQKALQCTQVQALQIFGNSKAPQVKLALPTLEYLFIHGAPVEVIDVANCPKLKRLGCLLLKEVSRPLQITAPGTCRVIADTYDKVTLHTVNAQEKEVVVESTLVDRANFSSNFGDSRLDYRPAPKEKAEKKSDAPKP